MYDLHGHYLPGLDDGARDWNEALAMARVAAEDGLRGIVCTPHWVRGCFENGRKAVLEAVGEFKARLRAEQIPLEVFPGSELRLDYELVDRVESKEILTINDTGRYVLVELPPEVLPRDLERFFWNLQVQGLTVILGHPERHPALLRDPARLVDWIGMGLLMQITAASLLGGFGKTVQGFSAQMLKHRLVHIISSDAHGIRVRTPRLSSAFLEAKRIVGEDLARRMVCDFPKRIIEGRAVTPFEPVPLDDRRGWHISWKNPLSFFKLTQGGCRDR